MKIEKESILRKERKMIKKIVIGFWLISTIMLGGTLPIIDSTQSHFGYETQLETLQQKKSVAEMASHTTLYFTTPLSSSWALKAGVSLEKKYGQVSEQQLSSPEGVTPLIEVQKQYSSSILLAEFKREALYNEKNLFLSEWHARYMPLWGGLQAVYTGMSGGEKALRLQGEYRVFTRAHEEMEWTLSGQTNSEAYAEKLSASDLFTSPLVEQLSQGNYLQTAWRFCYHDENSSGIIFEPMAGVIFFNTSLTPSTLSYEMVSYVESELALQNNITSNVALTPYITPGIYCQAKEKKVVTYATMGVRLSYQY